MRLGACSSKVKVPSSGVDETKARLTPAASNIRMMSAGDWRAQAGWL
jgi:hypothetical protein